jgi:predicted O-methyltransferase YrrM
MVGVAMNTATMARQIAAEAIAIEPGNQNEGEFSELIAMLLTTNPMRNVMEIGTERGCSFYAWCKASAPDGVKISLDWGWGASGTGNFRTAEARAERDNRLLGYAKNVVRIEGDSHFDSSLAVVKQVLNGELLDFLFIDGDHSEDGVRKDWEMYGPLVRPGGIVAFHDIKECEYHTRAGCFVHNFWRGLTGVRKSELISREHVWGGIGIVFPS